MSGADIVVDTSVIINLFNGVQAIQPLIESRNLFVSVISEIELLSFPKLSPAEKQTLKDFISDCYVIDIEPNIKELTINLRSQHKIKLPDAVIAATAIYFNLPLFTMDKGFSKIPDINVVMLAL